MGDISADGSPRQPRPIALHGPGLWLVRTLDAGRPALGTFLLYLAGAVLLTSSAWAAPTTRWIGSCCDPQQSIWFLRWIPYAISHGMDPLFTKQLNAPDGVNLMWNALVPLLGVVAAPVTLLGGPILAYNVVMTAVIVLDASFACLALRRYARGMVGPIVGGAVYGFSPFVVSHAVLHLNLATALAPPMFLILLDEVLVRRRRSPWLLGVAVGLLAVCQLLRRRSCSPRAPSPQLSSFACWQPAGPAVSWLVFAASFPPPLRRRAPSWWLRRGRWRCNSWVHNGSAAR